MVLKVLPTLHFDFIPNLKNFYLPKMKLLKGNVFTSVCQEFVRRGRCTPLLGRHPLGRQPLGRHTPWADTPFWADTLLGRHPPGSRHTPGSRHPLSDGHCSGWYTSYWNAFFLNYTYGTIYE